MHGQKNIKLQQYIIIHFNLIGDEFWSLDYRQAILTRNFKKQLYAVHIKFNVIWDPIKLTPVFKQNFNSGVNFIGFRMTLNLICPTCNRF